MAIPTSAATELVKINLSVYDLQNLYEQSYRNRFTVAPTSGQVVLYRIDNIQNATTLEPPSYIMSDVSYSFISGDRLFIYSDFLFYPVEYSSFSVGFEFDFPFPYIIDNESVIPISGFAVSNAIPNNAYVSFYDSESGSIAYSYGGFVTNGSVASWETLPLSAILDLHPQLQQIVPAFNNPFYADVEIPLTNPELSDDSVNYNAIEFVFAYSGSNTPALVATPLIFSIGSFDVYVEEEIAPTVESYLDAIAGPPTVANQEKINQLKLEMQEIDTQLKESAEDMAVDVPDISDVKNDIPEELQQGNELVSDAILRPILNIQPIATILLGTFAILALKLILFGSGPF